MIGRPLCKINFLFFLSVILCLPCLSAEADVFESIELSGKYEQLYKNKGTGWYLLDEYIVFVADLDRGDKQTSVREMRGRAMLRAAKEIRSWSMEKCGKIKCDLSKWPERSRNILREYLENKAQTPSMARFNGHLLENHPVGQRFRYAFAVPKKALNQFCSEIEQISAEPDFLFSRLLDQALKSENYRLASILLWDAGLPHLSARAALEGLAGTLCTSNFNLLPTPLAQREFTRKLLQGELEKTSENLGKIPGSYEILTAMTDELKGKEPEKSFAYLSLALAGSGGRADKILSMMDKLAVGKNTGTSEYRGSGHVLDLSIKSYGNLRFGNNIPAYEDGYLKQAMQLFHAHGDLEKIEELLESAADNVPANPKVWDYLGAILKAQKRWSIAVNVYLQLLQLRPFDAEALSHLAQCYAKTGKNDEAIIIADFIYYSGRAGSNKTVNRIIQEVRK